MKSLVVVALSALSFSALAQQTNQWAPFPENGIYLSAADFNTHTLTDGFDTGQPGYRLKNEALMPTVKVDEPNHPEVKLAMDGLWGERKLGVDYRIFDGQLYRVEHTDRVVVYSRSANLTGAGGNVYYFSRELNSPIHTITAENLKDIFYDQSAKMASFDELDALDKQPSLQARDLIVLFYKPTVSIQAAP